MGAGCVPDANERLQAFLRYRQAIAEALGILTNIEHPDDAPRKVEEAAGLLISVQGQRAHWSIDTTEPWGITDLMEHYFS